MKKLKECNKQNQIQDITNNYLLSREIVGEIFRKLNQLYLENEDIDIFTIKRRNLMPEIQRTKIVQLTLRSKDAF